MTPDAVVTDITYLMHMFVISFKYYIHGKEACTDLCQRDTPARPLTHTESLAEHPSESVPDHHGAPVVEARGVDGPPVLRLEELQHLLHERARA